LSTVDAEYLARQTDHTLKPQIRNNEACALATCLKYRPVEAGVVSGDEIDALEELVEAWPHVGKGRSFAGHLPRDFMEVGEDELLPGRAQQGVKLVDYLAVFDSNHCHRAGGIAIVVRGLKVYCPEPAAILPNAQADTP